jgi:hypothetical protein
VFEERSENESELGKGCEVGAQALLLYSEEGERATAEQQWPSMAMGAAGLDCNQVRALNWRGMEGD